MSVNGGAAYPTRVTVTGVFLDPATGAPATPSVVKLRVKPPTSALEPLDPDGQDPTTKVYSASFDLDEAGVWRWQWVASGSLKIAGPINELRVDGLL